MGASVVTAVSLRPAMDEARGGDGTFDASPASGSRRCGPSSLLCAREVIIAAAGVLVVQAALSFDPNRAKGLDAHSKPSPTHSSARGCSC
jgi:hypothetical protein